MTIRIKSVLEVGKSLAIKLEKGEDSQEVHFAHLKFSALFVTREQIDALADQEEGWARGALFDELGGPVARLWISLHGTEFRLTGKIGIPEDEDHLKLIDATLSDLELYLMPNGAALSGHIRWKVAGDESADAEGMLGKTCSADWSLFPPVQADMLKADAKKAVKDAVKRIAENGGATITVNGESVVIPAKAKRRGGKGSEARA